MKYYSHLSNAYKKLGKPCVLNPRGRNYLAVKCKQVIAWILDYIWGNNIDSRLKHINTITFKRRHPRIVTNARLTPTHGYRLPSLNHDLDPGTPLSTINLLTRSHARLYLTAYKSVVLCWLTQGSIQSIQTARR